MLELRYLRCQQ